MARSTEHEREAVIKAAREGRGKVAKIANILDVTPQTVYNYADRWVTVRDAIDEARRDFSESLVDKAELELEKAVEDGKAWAIKYALDTQGKGRGYTQRQELTGAEGGPIEQAVTIYIPDNERD